MNQSETNKMLNNFDINDMFNDMVQINLSLDFTSFEKEYKPKFDNKRITNRAEAHLHLVEKCILTKRTDILSEKNLRKHGLLALRTASLDFNENGCFEDFALARIEKFMNSAIAEAFMLSELSNEQKSKDYICNEFASIHNRFSTLLF